MRRYVRNFYSYNSIDDLHVDYDKRVPRRTRVLCDLAFHVHGAFLGLKSQAAICVGTICGREWGGVRRTYVTKDHRDGSAFLLLLGPLFCVVPFF